MKKFTLLGMIVAALAAFVVPAAASASPVLTSTDNPGVPIAAGKTIVGTSTNAVTKNTKLGELTCEKVTISAKVKENTGTTITAEGEAEKGTTAGCKAAGKTLEIKKPSLVTLHTGGTTAADTGLLSMSFIAKVGAVECEYHSTGTTTTVPFTYTTGKDEIHISGATLESPAPLCEPPSGHPEFSADFTLETPTTTPVPVIIS